MPNFEDWFTLLLYHTPQTVLCFSTSFNVFQRFLLLVATHILRNRKRSRHYTWKYTVVSYACNLKEDSFVRSSLAGHALLILSLSVSSAVRILRPWPCFLLVSFRRRGKNKSAWPLTSPILFQRATEFLCSPLKFSALSFLGPIDHQCLVQQKLPNKLHMTFRKGSFLFIQALKLKTAPRDLKLRAFFFFGPFGLLGLLGLLTSFFLGLRRLTWDSDSDSSAKEVSK